MTTVNIEEIENLANILSKSSSDADEWLNRLRGLYTEMQNDVEFMVYPQFEKILQNVLVAVEHLNQSNDTLQSLKTIIMHAPDIYRENEKKNKDALDRMTAYLDSVNVDYSTVIFSNIIPQIECTPSVNSQDKVQELVANSVSDMQLTNISAISKTVREEYEVKYTKPLVSRL